MAAEWGRPPHREAELPGRGGDGPAKRQRLKVIDDCLPKVEGAHREVRRPDRSRPGARETTAMGSTGADRTARRAPRRRGCPQAREHSRPWIPSGPVPPWAGRRWRASSQGRQPGRSQLGVAGDHDPGPAVRCFGSAGASWGGPAPVCFVKRKVSSRSKRRRDACQERGSTPSGGAPVLEEAATHAGRSGPSTGTRPSAGSSAVGQGQFTLAVEPWGAVGESWVPAGPMPALQPAAFAGIRVVIAASARPPAWRAQFRAALGGHPLFRPWTRGGAGRRMARSGRTRPASPLRDRRRNSPDRPGPVTATSTRGGQERGGLARRGRNTAPLQAAQSRTSVIRKRPCSPAGLLLLPIMFRLG